MKLNLNVQTNNLIKSLQDTVNMTNDYRPLFRLIMGKVDDNSWWTFRGSVAKAFASKTSPLDAAWAELAKSTQKYKEKFFTGAPMLVRTGKLFNSLVRGGEGAVAIMDKKTFRFGTTIDYAGYHNNPNAARTKIPLRQFLGISVPQRKQINGLIKAYVLATMNGKKRTADEGKGLV